MRPHDIRMGATYRGRGKRKTIRTVLYIGSSPPEPPRVIYRDYRGRRRDTSLTSFARWADEEVLVYVG